MKNFVSTLFCLLLCVSCNDEQIIQQELAPIKASEIEDSGIVAYPKRQMKTRSQSIEQNWEKWETVILASGDTVQVPWNKNNTSGAVPYDIRNDIEAKNGWDLIAHTVNGYGSQGKNYLIFHNKYTGILKVFYYMEPGQSNLQNTAIWKLYFEVPSSNLAFADEYAALSTRKDKREIYLSNLTNDDTRGFTLGWNCFQTELAYDPDFAGGMLQIIPFSMTTSQILLDGNLEANTDGFIISTTNSNIMRGSVNVAANFAGEKAEETIKEAAQKGVFKKIGSVLAKGAGSIVKLGISKLLGTFVGGFNQQHQTTQSVQLRTKGTVTIKGNEMTPATGAVVGLSFSINPQDVGKLGVWSLKETPTVRLNPFGLHKMQAPNAEYVQFYNINSPYVYSLDLQEILNINPEILSQVEKYEIEGTVYETDSVVARDVLHQGMSSVGFMFSGDSEQLYNDVYSPNDIYVGVVLKDENGIDLPNFEKYAPIEAYIPNTIDGKPGAQPSFTFDSKYILVVTLRLFVNNDGEQNTIESTHTFIPDFEWDYGSSPDEYYNAYPYVPIQAKVSALVLKADSLSFQMPEDSIMNQQPLPVDSTGIVIEKELKKQ